MQATEYHHYPSGNLLNRIDALSSLDEEFQYDGARRLKTWTNNGARDLVHAYTYTLDGNVDTITRGTNGNPTAFGVDQYGYGDNGAGPHGVSQVGSRDHEYDARGRRWRTYQGGNLETEIEYSWFDLPKRVTKDGSLSTYRYDADQQRVERRVEGVPTSYAGDLFEQTLAATREVSQFHVFAEGRRVARIEFVNNTATGSTSETTTYLQDDPMGSVSVVTSSAGAVDAHLYYAPFGDRIDLTGVPLSVSGAGTLRYGFTDHEHDDESGLINAGGRMYDSTTGRFLTPDPVVSNVLDGQAINPYSYVKNRPLELIDPTGLWDCSVATCSAVTSMTTTVSGGSTTHTTVTTSVDLRPPEDSSSARVALPQHGEIGPSGGLYFQPGQSSESGTSLGGLSQAHTGEAKGLLPVGQSAGGPGYHWPTKEIAHAQGSPVPNVNSAAYAALDRAYAPSRKYRVEIGGGIFEVAPGAYVIGSFYVGEEGEIYDLGSRLKQEASRYPGARLAATWHIHHHGPGGEEPSDEDRFTTSKLKAVGYIATPTGRFVAFSGPKTVDGGKLPPQPSKYNPLDAEVRAIVRARMSASKKKSR